MINKLKEFVFDKETKKLKLSFLVAVGLAGMILIMLSGLDFNDGENKSVKSPEALFPDSTEDYRLRLQSDLEEILSSVSGAGRVSVMLSLEGTTEYVYAQQIHSSSDVEENKTSSDYENELVMIEQGGEKNALVTKILRPKVSGVLIVCDGADDIVLTEKLINSAASALGITTANISVAKRKA